MPDINMQVFEEAKRNQLVTEVDIQTQVALDDYQVPLSNIANPTQSQDNVVIDRFGEFLPHWNESLDFDTWVKMSMEIAGKRLLMLCGNSNVSNINSINDTFIDGSEFNDLTGWTEQAGSWSVSGGILSSPTTADGYLRRDVPISELSYIVETKGRTTNNLRFSVVLEANNPLVGPSASLTGMILPGTNNLDLRANWAWTPTAMTFDDNTWYIQKIRVDSGNNLITAYTESRSLVGTDGIQASDGSGTGNYWGFYESADAYDIDWVFIRKYTAVEPTHSIGTPKNISTALKSFGRAG